VNYSISKAKADEALPQHLLLLADENPKLIDTYLPLSEIFLLKSANQVLGICVLQQRDLTGEVMNIAIEPTFQGQGLGKALLQHVIGVAREQGVLSLLIKTGNSGIGQIALYQQQGFDLVAVNYNYFLQAYPQPIWENKIQCKHQLVFELALNY
jgi:ribosomal protein S18 acetylase RimI-like enzyme